MTGYRFKKQKSRGFSLVELVVVVAIFMLIVTAGLFIFFSVVKGQKSVLYQQKVLNQVSYVLEHMSKAMRMAKVDDSGSCLPIGDPSVPGENIKHIYGFTKPQMNADAFNFYGGIKFINESNNSACTEFYVENGVLYEASNGAAPVALTSDDIQINYIKFKSGGSSLKAPHSSIDRYPYLFSMNVQPVLTMVLSVQTGNLDQEMLIQTTVAERNLNFSAE